MHVVILGTAAGGGAPQWNCGCRGCDATRRGMLPSRTHAAALIHGGWSGFLLNAGPDIGSQLSGLVSSAAGTRAAPFDAILLTDAELDATSGLLSLRQADRLVIYATSWVREALSASRVLSVLAAYCDVVWRTVEIGAPFVLSDGAIEAVAFATGHGKTPAYHRVPPTDETTVGFTVRDLGTGTSLAYAPTIGSLERCVATLAQSDCVLADGTFWSDDELAGVGSSKTASEMGHVPMGGLAGSLHSRPQGPRWIYTHINNTNPVLFDGAARSCVARSGAEIATDGMEIEV
ncbi:MAG: pyrroloquinoline quinone biosynthesis protein PqqB [Acidimicrobiales bacterium]